jgi:hypothetical protein
MPVVGLVLLAGALVAMPRSPVAILIGMLNVVFIAAAARRLWVLRQTGPFVRTLLDAPAQIASVQQLPKKLGPRQRPLMITIATKTNAECALLLDRKRYEDNAALVRHLHERSPDAVIVFQTLTTTQAAR